MTNIFDISSRQILPNQAENMEIPFKITEEELNGPMEDAFEIVCKLGEGSYGCVFKARHKSSNAILAVKRVPVDSDLKDIVKEINIMQQCDSEFVVKYFGSYYQNMDLWIIMEYCAAGSILDVMKALHRTLSEENIGRIMYDTIRGLEYLHLRRKIHRDVKAGNILVSAIGTAKLADFGVSGQLTDTLAKRNTVIGTPFWMAPEVIQEVGYDSKADIWSLGITCIEMAEGKPPHSNIHPMRAIFMIPARPPPALGDTGKWSQTFHNFLVQCLHKDPAERKNSTQLLQHDFVKAHKMSLSVGELVREAKKSEKAVRTPLVVGNPLSSIFGGNDSNGGGSSDNSGKQSFTDSPSGTIYRTAIQNVKEEMLRFKEGFNDMLLPELSSFDQGTVEIRKFKDSPEPVFDHVSGTCIINEESAYEDDDSTTTFKQNKLKQNANSSCEDDKPLFLKMMTPEVAASDNKSDTENKNKKAKKDTLEKEILQNIPIDQNGQIDVAALTNLPISELVKRLENVEKDRASDIEKIRHFYHEKRKPILEALSHKTNGNLKIS